MEVTYRHSTQDKYSLVTDYRGLRAAGHYVSNFYIRLNLHETFNVCKVNRNGTRAAKYLSESLEFQEGWKTSELLNDS